MKLIQEVLEAWPEDQAELKQAFVELAAEAQNQPETKLSLVSREVVSHSLRASVEAPGRERPVYFLVDVIVSSADPWFLSACFYEDEIDDPEELGNPIPAGLFEETGYCFDVDDYDAELLAYIKARIGRARISAASA